MAVPIAPRELPLVVLSRELGDNASRDAAAQGLIRAGRATFTRPLEDESLHRRADHLAMAKVVGVWRRLTHPTFSHRTAALIHGLWLVDDDTAVHVTQQVRPGRNSEDPRRHCATLCAQDVTMVNGLRVTTIERTIVDCAKSMHPRDALVVADSGMRALIRPRRDKPELSATDIDELRVRLLRMVDVGDRRHRRRARAVIEAADPFSESPYETVVRWIAISRGLPRPTLQARFVIEGHVQYPDMWWLLHVTHHGTLLEVINIFAEYDGQTKYLPDDPDDPDDDAEVRRVASQSIMAERRRENRLRTVRGSTVVRFDHQDLADYDAVFRRLCAPLPAAFVSGLRPVAALLGGPLPPRVTSR